MSNRFILLTTFAFLIFLTGCCDKKNIPKFNNSLYSAVAKERNQAALDLARCGDLAAGSVSRLTQMLYDDNAGVQSSAAYALREIDTPAARKAIEEVMSRRKKK